MSTLALCTRNTWQFHIHNWSEYIAESCRDIPLIWIFCDTINICMRIKFYKEFTSVTPRAMHTAPTHTKFFNRKSLIAPTQPWGEACGPKVVHRNHMKMTFASRPFCGLSPCPVHTLQFSPCSRSLAQPHGFSSPHYWTSQRSCPHHSSGTAAKIVIHLTSSHDCAKIKVDKQQNSPEDTPVLLFVGIIPTCRTFSWILLMSCLFSGLYSLITPRALVLIALFICRRAAYKGSKIKILSWLHKSNNVSCVMPWGAL